MPIASFSVAGTERDRAGHGSRWGEGAAFNTWGSFALVCHRDPALGQGDTLMVVTANSPV